MRKELDFENLKTCLDNYSFDSIFIRLIGSSGGTVKFNEDLEGKKLNFKKNESGLHLFTNSKEIFHFSLKDYHKGFALAYERIGEDGHVVLLGDGEDPYGLKLPKPKKSFLRTVLDDHLMEIYFKGRVDLEFESWRDESCNCKYWKVIKPRADLIKKVNDFFSKEFKVDENSNNYFHLL